MDVFKCVDKLSIVARRTFLKLIFRILIASSFVVYPQINSGTASFEMPIGKVFFYGKNTSG